ncbi:hypothetical protein Tco_0407294 [Tanacetum coccineum]
MESRLAVFMTFCPINQSTAHSYSKIATQLSAEVKEYSMSLSHNETESYSLSGSVLFVSRDIGLYSDRGAKVLVGVVPHIYRIVCAHEVVAGCLSLAAVLAGCGGVEQKCLRPHLERKERIVDQDREILVFVRRVEVEKCIGCLAVRREERSSRSAHPP